MRKINKIKIYKNNNAKSKKVYNQLITLLTQYKFEIVDENFDLGIAIGGDGSLLRLIKQENYNEKALYVGINAGTLGFLQEVTFDKLDDFVEKINENDYQQKKVGIQENTIKTTTKKVKLLSLNEIVIREKDLNTIYLDVTVEKSHLEKFVGDGLLISTSLGSTAYNLSFRGAIVYDSLHTLQITPIAPLNNKVYRNIVNSIIIPHRRAIYLKPFDRTKDLLISVDGENHIFEDVQYVRTCVNKKQLNFLRLGDNDYWHKVNDKFISNNK